MHWVISGLDDSEEGILVAELFVEELVVVIYKVAT